MNAALGPIAGWVALASVPLAAVAGWVTRRFARGVLRARMRPHYIAGYAVLAVALVHAGASMGAMAGSDATGVWLATLALLGLIWQGLLGSNLQSPGDYRVPLRRWHLVTFVAVAVLASAHALLNR